MRAKIYPLNRPQCKNADMKFVRMSQKQISQTSKQSLTLVHPVPAIPNKNSSYIRKSTRL